MKKTAAILLLSILAFNWTGYRFVSAWLESRAGNTFQAQIDHEDYDEASLIQITVPLNTPYLSGIAGNLERYDGEVELEGVHYHYVKRQISGGNVVLYCLPNEGRKRVQNSRMDFFKLVNDLNHSTQKDGNTGSSFKSFTAEYTQENNSWNIIAMAPVPCPPADTYPSSTASGFGKVVKQPPRA